MQNETPEIRLTRIETILPTLATKADLTELRAELRADMNKLGSRLDIAMARLHTDFEKGQKESARWILGAIITFFVATLGILVTFITIMPRVALPLH